MPASPRPPSFLAILLAAGTVALAAACASIESNAMQGIVDSWKGAPVEQAKAQWGPPQAVQTVPGGTAYVWTEEMPVARPPGSGPRDAGLEPPARVAQCQRKLVAGADGNVSRGEWSGTACCVQRVIGQCATLARKPAGQG
ncbi:hypothetical protein [Cupriavidus pauculus]|uniref:Lipoprotein n=1 Tax=Cupriavidus pauculus TaxID=82633 RepID=A0A3G8H5G0_9BURK|nr:hypothetical protein [Cupriavidus pauculus]AZG15783.1 hypothetical protein EHF44_20225 [Cupriavidus pauculus]